MSDFSDRPFVAGSLVGLRAFDVDALGRLVGPAFGGVFKPGENVATCGGGNSLALAQARLTAHLAQLTMSHKELRRIAGGTVTYETGKPDPSKATPSVHQVAGVKCGCGYYAFFNGENAYHKPGRVSAIVEGYGTCTVGDKGFRAEKARIVALVLPNARRRFFGSWKASALVLALWIVSGAMSVERGHWVAAAIDAALAVGWSVSLVLRIRSALRRKGSGDALVARNYPDVPVYRTVRAALRAHPLTPPALPPAPGPEDENFWTMAVPK